MEMGTRVKGEVVNYKYWQSLRPAETQHKNNLPSKEAIEFERHLQFLESENRLYEMGVAMKKASQEKSKDMICSIEALMCDSQSKRRRSSDSRWYLTKDQTVDNAEDIKIDSLLAIVEKEPEYQPIIQKIEQVPSNAT